jgi:hypothetical protein
MMTRSGRRLLTTLTLLGMVAAAAGPVAADPAAVPVTIRGNNAPAVQVADGSSIVLRGTPAPAPPPVVHYACPPGYENDAEAGCVAPGYGSEPDYEWYWTPYDVGRRRGFRPHHHAVSGFARRPGFGRGPGFHGMPAHAFGGHR